MSGYGITFAPTLERPPETMVGETVYDAEGNAIGWIVNAPAEPDEATMLKLHERMNAALLDMQEELLALHTQDRENASSKELIDCVIRAHQIIEDAATAGVGTCKAIDTGYATAKCSECGAEFMGSIMTNEPPDYVKPLERCPRCGRRIIEED